jgi:hypothetical protein
MGDALLFDPCGCLHGTAGPGGTCRGAGRTADARRHGDDFRSPVHRAGRLLGGGGQVHRAARQAESPHLAEYASLSEIDASDDWGNDYFDKTFPEGSAVRDSANTAFEEHFLKYFGEHEDNILAVNLKRSK